MKFFLAVALTALATCSGCVVRELIVKSDPPGAVVYINGYKAGKTPLTKTFDFYGSREIALRKDEYLTTTKIVTPSVPWYEFFPLDFISEILLPVRIYNRHEYSFTLKPLPEQPPQDLLEKANKARNDE